MPALTRLPTPLARIAMAANREPRLVLGARYAHHRRFVQEARDTDDRAVARLLSLVNHAARTVPYYRQRVAGRPVDSLTEFTAMYEPIDKRSMLADLDAFIADDINRSAFEWCSTGGTSGKPLRFLAPINRYIVEMATMHALWARAGYAFDARAVIRNHHVDRPYVVNPVTREVIFDGFRLDDLSLFRVYETIRSRWIVS